MAISDINIICGFSILRLGCYLERVEKKGGKSVVGTNYRYYPSMYDSVDGVCCLLFSRLVIMLRIKKWITGWNSKHELLPLEVQKNRSRTKCSSNRPPSFNLNSSFTPNFSFDCLNFCEVVGGYNWLAFCWVRIFLKRF